MSQPFARAAAMFAAIQSMLTAGLSQQQIAASVGEYRSREAARLFFIVEGHADPRRSPLPPETFTGPPSQRVAALYRGLLPRLPRLLAAPGGWRALWQDQEAHLAASEALVASGRAVIEEEPELDHGELAEP